MHLLKSPTDYKYCVTANGEWLY
uniref:Uncharacterized protein n=1 Tax=Anguilla anguilla TaxID=7936 RepID=A0A0E9Q6R8_ANGAN